MECEVKAMGKIILISLVGLFAFSQDLYTELTMNPSDPDLAFKYALQVCEKKASVNVNRCIKSFAYVVVLEPSYTERCLKALADFGVEMSAEELMTEARQVIIDTIRQEIEIFKIERFRDPNEKDIRRILRKDPISSFKDPFTGKRVDVEFVREYLGVNF